MGQTKGNEEPGNY